MKQIVLKLTIAKGWASHILYRFFKHPYTHIALSFDDITFYSFTNHGFTLESKRKYIPKKWNDCYCYYYIDVHDENYNQLIDFIHTFEQRKNSFQYSYLTIIGAFFNLSIQEKNKFTCSQFVADLLQKSGVHHFKRKSCQYLPYQIVNEIKNMSRKEEYRYS